MKYLIGDKVEISAIGIVTRVESTTDGRLCYKIMNDDMQTTCYVYEDNITNLHENTRSQEESNVTTNSN